MALGDDEEITLKCPKCDRKSEHVFGRLKLNPFYNCPGCGARTEVDSSELSAAFKEVERKIENMLSKFR